MYYQSDYFISTFILILFNCIFLFINVFYNSCVRSQIIYSHNNFLFYIYFITNVFSFFLYLFIVIYWEGWSSISRGSKSWTVAHILRPKQSWETSRSSPNNRPRVPISAAVWVIIRIGSEGKLRTWSRETGPDRRNRFTPELLVWEQIFTKELPHPGPEDRHPAAAPSQSAAPLFAARTRSQSYSQTFTAAFWVI